MKTTGFFSKETFQFGMLRQLFRRSKPAEKSTSIEDLRAEISTEEYRKKVEYLLKQDLLLKYDAATVEKVLKNFNLHLLPVNTSNSLIVEKEEPLTAHIKAEPEVQEHEIVIDEKKQEIWKVHSRIPKWFSNPHQINSRILIAYLEILGDGNSVPLYKLEQECRTIKTFKSNYS